MYPATLEFAPTPQSPTFTRVIVYDNNQKRDDLPSLPGHLIDYAIKNGYHRVVVNAWDASGKLYQASTTFTVIGQGIGFCKAGAVGVTICAPSGYQPNDAVPVSMAALGATTMKSWTMYLDGQTVMSSSQTGTPNYVLTSLGTTAGTHTVSFTAFDTAGHTYKASRQFGAYYDYSCSPKTGVCSPGIVVQSPSGFSTEQAADVGQQFHLTASVQGNPRPITAMKIYLDGVNVFSTQGPGVTADLHAAPGSHFVVVQAWDTAGKLYRTYGNVYVQ